MKKDWRNTKWRDFSKEQKRWFIVLVVFIVVLILKRRKGYLCAEAV